MMLSRMLALARAASIVPEGMLYFSAVSRTNSARAIGNGWVFGTTADATGGNAGAVGVGIDDFGGGVCVTHAASARTSEHVNT